MLFYFNIYGTLVIIGEVLTILITASIFQFIYSRKLSSSVKKLKDILAQKAREALKSRLQLEQLSREVNNNENITIKKYTDYLDEELAKNQTKYNMLDFEEEMSLSFDIPQEIRILSLRNALLRTERQSISPGANSDMPWCKLDESLQTHANKHYQDDGHLPDYTPVSKGELNNSQNKGHATNTDDETTQRADIVNDQSQSLYDGYSSPKNNHDDSTLFDGYISSQNNHDDSTLFDGYEKQCHESKNTKLIHKQILDENKKRKDEIYKQLSQYSDKLQDNSFENLMTEIQSIDEKIYDIAKDSKSHSKEIIMDYPSENKKEQSKNISEIQQLRKQVKEKQSEIKTLKQEFQETGNSDLMKNIMDLQDEQLEIYKHQLATTENHIEFLGHELSHCQQDLEHFKTISSSPKADNLEKALEIKDREINHLKKELFDTQNNTTHQEILDLKDEKIHTQERQLKESEMAVITMEQEITNTRIEIKALKRALLRAKESIDQMNLLQKENQALSKDNKRLLRTISDMERNAGPY